MYLKTIVKNSSEINWPLGENPRWNNSSTRKITIVENNPLLTEILKKSKFE